MVRMSEVDGDKMRTVEGLARRRGDLVRAVRGVLLLPSAVAAVQYRVLVAHAHAGVARESVVRAGQARERRALPCTDRGGERGGCGCGPGVSEGGRNMCVSGIEGKEAAWMLLSVSHRKASRPGAAAARRHPARRTKSAPHDEGTVGEGQGRMLRGVQMAQIGDEIRA